MKRLLVTLMLLLSVSISAQVKNYLYDWNGTKLGGYAGTAGKISSLNSETAGYLDLKAAVTFNGKWAVGFSVSGLYYDKPLRQLVDDGTYHLYVSYAGLFVERIFSLTDDFKLSLSVLTGQGEAYYQYDKDFRKDKKWNEEVIDRTTFHIFEPGIELQHRVSGNFWLGITASVRSGSPLELYSAPEDMLHKGSAGVTLKWGVF